MTYLSQLTYSYKKLTDPSEAELNKLGADGWRVISATYGESKGIYTSSSALIVLMERPNG